LIVLKDKLLLDPLVWIVKFIISLLIVHIFKYLQCPNLPKELPYTLTFALNQIICCNVPCYVKNSCWFLIVNMHLSSMCAVHYW